MKTYLAISATAAVLLWSALVSSVCGEIVVSVQLVMTKLLHRPYKLIGPQVLGPGWLHSIQSVGIIIHCSES